MRRLFAKIKRVRMTPWKNLTTGEKIMKFIMKLIKIAVIVAIVLAVGYVLAMMAAVMIILAAIGLGDSGYREYR